MTTTNNLPLPTGYDARPPTRKDAGAVAEVMTTSRAAYGDEEVATAEDVLDDWQGVDLAQEAVVVTAPDGRIVGNADIYNRRNMRVSVYGNVAPSEQGRGVGMFLVNWGEEWARERMNAAPEGAKVAVEHYIDSQNTPAQKLMESLDYPRIRTVYVMEITLDEAPPAPIWPEGARGRAFVRGQDEHATWSAVEIAFRDLLERPPGAYERWLAMTESERREPDLWRLAEDQRDGAIVGTVLGKRFSGGGWVGGVGVRRDWRGKGLALALLHDLFGVFYTSGVREISLSVDADSPSSAPSLYTRAGMHVTKNIGIYRKTLREGTDWSVILPEEA
ncbi:MAG TPA: GNAT family N-acetyltransferase [Ktedonobacterales bacterium]|jgi:mycothiol synthase|nr:GNAT family N-acetyltransferase [Ktedonobacterales bacterium]